MALSKMISKERKVMKQPMTEEQKANRQAERKIAGTLQEWFKGKSCQDIGAALVSYIHESEHSSWDGHEPRDQAARNRLLHDFFLYASNLEDYDPAMFGGVDFWTTDRPVAQPQDQRGRVDEWQQDRIDARAAREHVAKLWNRRAKQKMGQPMA